MPTKTWILNLLKVGNGAVLRFKRFLNKWIYQGAVVSYQWQERSGPSHRERGIFLPLHLSDKRNREPLNPIAANSILAIARSEGISLPSCPNCWRQHPLKILCARLQRCMILETLHPRRASLVTLTQLDCKGGEILTIPPASLILGLLTSIRYYDRIVALCGSIAAWCR
jgi:hypothetical protein